MRLFYRCKESGADAVSWQAPALYTALPVFLILLITLALSAANGANDNIQGAVTLVGSGLTDYRRTIVLATALAAVTYAALAGYGLT